MQRVAEGVWLLSGRPAYAVNVYLAGNILFDAGTRWARRRIVRQLQGQRPALVALTHCHPDHQGAAHAVCTHFNVPFACHQADVPAAEGREPMLPRNWMIRAGDASGPGPRTGWSRSCATAIKWATSASFTPQGTRPAT